MNKYPITAMEVGKLLAHPLNRKLYGNESLDVGLLESVRNLGIIEPITVITMRSVDPAEYADGAHVAMSNYASVTINTYHLKR
jgi:hypothetical protein